MAAATITPVKLVRNTFSSAIAANTAVHAEDGALFTMSDSDHRYLIVVENASDSAAKTVTIKAGDSYAATVDIEQELAAGTTRYINIDSARFKNLSGTNKGKVAITGTDENIKVSVYILP